MSRNPSMTCEDIGIFVNQHRVRESKDLNAVGDLLDLLL
jgi:hypothetical protein